MKSLHRLLTFVLFFASCFVVFSCKQISDETGKKGKVEAEPSDTDGLRLVCRP